MSEEVIGTPIDVSKPTVEGLALIIEYQKTLNATKALEAKLAVENTMVAKVLKGINNALVFAAGALVAVAIGCAAVSAIMWLLVQMRHLIWG